MVASPATVAQPPPGGGGGGGGALPEPQGHAQPQYPLSVDVIAGSVVTLNVGKIMDQDTLSGSGQLVGDPWWTYSASATGGVVLEQIPGPQNDLVAALTVVYQAPDSNGDVTLTVDATDVETPPGQQWPPNATDAPFGFPAYTIHVHQLEVYELDQGGCDLEWDQTYPGSPTQPPHLWTCNEWDSDGGLTGIRYVRGGIERPMYFAGGWEATVGVTVRGKGGWTGAVLPTNLRLVAPWTTEKSSSFWAPGADVSLVTEKRLGVTSLPVVGLQAETSAWNSSFGGFWMPAAIDHKVTHDASFAWDWDALVFTDPDILGHSEYEAWCDVDDATLPWVASSYSAPLLGNWELSLQRIQSVCGKLAGRDVPEDLADEAVHWALDHLTFSGRYMGTFDPDDPSTPPLETEDVWCVICLGGPFGGRGDADCITGARLAVAALKLVGVDAEAVHLYPQPTRGAPWSWEENARTCWATDPQHPGYHVGYMEGGFNYFEGAFKLNGLYWTVFDPSYRHTHPQDVITSMMECLACSEDGVAVHRSGELTTDPITGETLHHTLETH
jgi:hypothetical protein